MESYTVNVLLSTFSGLNLPRTLSLPMLSTTTISNVHERIVSLLPASIQPQRFLLTTTSSRRLSTSSSSTLQELVSEDNGSLSQRAFLPLQICPRTLGGKGGFGSQLRAQGGRMSSRKKRNQANTPNSNRNLEGRRIRTVDEAKALAAYLEVKPDMDKKEKEARRKRWEKVLEDAERKEREMKEGKGRMSDAAWLEEKEEGEERIREALKKSLSGAFQEDSDESPTNSESDESEGGGSSPNSSAHDETMPDATQAKANNSVTTETKAVFGWDDDDDDDDYSDDEDEDEGND